VTTFFRLLVSSHAALPARPWQCRAAQSRCAVRHNCRSGGTPDDTVPPAQRPRILGFGSEPVLPTEGAFWRLPSGAGVLTMVLDAPHATRVEFWLTPTGTGVSDLSRKIGQDTNGRDGWLFNWHYPNEPILGHLTVRAIGPGGTDEETVGVYHPDPGEQP